MRQHYHFLKIRVRFMGITVNRRSKQTYFFFKIIHSAVESFFQAVKLLVKILNKFAEIFSHMTKDKSLINKE